MEIFGIKNLSFYYPNQSAPALDSIDLSVNEGEFVTICGMSGCGKTTLLRQLKPALRPHGSLCGEIFFEGAPLDSVDHRSQSQKIGFVLQSPENQIVTDKVWHELAFGMESLGLKTPEIRRKSAEMAAFFDIEDWFFKDVNQLSGGQKQILNLAAIMAMQPKVLLLDEPTSRLDPIGASDFLAAVSKINRDLGVTVILAEHRVDEALPLSDRLIAMENGRIIVDGKPKEAGQRLKTAAPGLFAAMPAPMRVYSAVNSPTPCPITVREGRSWLADYSKSVNLKVVDQTVNDFTGAPLAVDVKDVYFRYSQKSEDILKGLDFTAPRGSISAILGGNGAGKTTLLSVIGGQNKPQRGKIAVDQSVNDEETGAKAPVAVLLPQNPQSLFLKPTVKENLIEALPLTKRSTDAHDAQILEIATLCEIESLLSRHPFDLSGGEMQRVALAMVLLTKSPILLLDEPTKGLDGFFKEKLALILKKLAQSGKTIVMVSHDLDFCAHVCDFCAMMFGGQVVSAGNPYDFFNGNSFYTTPANRMARGIIDNAITAEDIILALNGRPPSGHDSHESSPKNPPPAAAEPPKKPADAGVKATKAKAPKGTVLAAIMILLLIPLTLILGEKYLGGRKYFVISLLVILETMVPFFMLFEGRRPPAREVVLMASLCAIAVAGRAAFFFLPQVKPVAALVIISAAALGPEKGFAIGALSMLLSNMFFAQGPFAPFQMFAMGIIGFLAGLLFYGRKIGKNRLFLCLYGGLSTFVIYGVIMNLYTVFQTQEVITARLFWAATLAGAPMDLIHAASTVVFLLIAARPMMEKLDRIKVKYGIS